MKLFEPIRIGPLEVKNRVVFPPMGTMLANPLGTVSQRLIDYYARAHTDKVLSELGHSGKEIEEVRCRGVVN